MYHFLFNVDPSFFVGYSVKTPFEIRVTYDVRDDEVKNIRAQMNLECLALIGRRSALVEDIEEAAKHNYEYVKSMNTSPTKMAANDQDDLRDWPFSID